MASRFEDRLEARPVAQTVSTAGLRSLTLWADDRAAGQAWQQGLLPEGLCIEAAERPAPTVTAT